MQQAEREAAGLDDEEEEGPAGSDEEGEPVSCGWLGGGGTGPSFNLLPHKRGAAGITAWHSPSLTEAHLHAHAGWVHPLGC